MLMDCLHACPNGIIGCHTSDMMLKITSNAACLVQLKARSRAAAHFHLSWLNNDQTNGPLDMPCQTIKNVHVISVAAKIKTGGTCLGGKHACPMRAALEELGHPQPTTGTPFRTNNSTAQGILNSKMCQNSQNPSTRAAGG
jgi:hypothetical protein